MVRSALLPVVFVSLVLLAGCSAGIPGLSPQPTPVDIDARITGTTSTGGTCVGNATNGFVVESLPNDDGTRTVTVAANVTVPGAHHVVDGFALTQTGETAYRLDVNTTASTEKPEKTCENGGIVPYEVTMRVPDTSSFSLQIRHNGQPVSGVGSGGET